MEIYLLHDEVDEDSLAEQHYHVLLAWLLNLLPRQHIIFYLILKCKLQ